MSRSRLVALVTDAGSGIEPGVCRSLSRGGQRAVVVADLAVHRYRTLFGMNLDALNQCVLGARLDEITVLQVGRKPTPRRISAVAGRGGTSVDLPERIDLSRMNVTVPS